METKTKKTGFGDPELDELLESLHESIRRKGYKKEGSVELIKRLRREESERREKEVILHPDV